MKHAAATLGSGNLRLAVMLPEGEDLNEWVAVNSKKIFQISTFFWKLKIKISNIYFLFLQLLIFLTKSICCMAQSPNSAQKKAVQLCRRDQNTNTIGQMVTL